MIDLYSWSTPNGRKVSIMLEEVGLPYEVHRVNIGKGEQFRADFLKIAPNNKIPAIIDREAAVSLFESGAILIYLAEKTGMLLPRQGKAKWPVIEWLMWQMGGVGPIIGQTHHFVKDNAGKAPYAETRFLTETKRLYGVLDRRLADSEFVAGNYSIADIAIWPWLSRFQWHQIDMDEFANVKRWYKGIAARPAVQKGYHVPTKQNAIPMPG